MEKLILRGVLVAVLGASGLVLADAKLDEAKQHLTTGTQLYDENNFRGALVELQRAYDLAPSYKILFNIGQVEMELQDYAGALKAYTRYLSEGGPDVPPDRQKDISAEVERLKGRVGHITVQTAAGAEVQLDDVSVGFAPLPEPVPVNAGSHKVTVHVTGKDPVSRIYDVAGRQDVTAAIGNEQAPVPVPPPADKVMPPPVVKAPAGPKNRMPIYVGWGVTGGLVLGAGAFALIAHGADNDLSDMRATYPVTKADLDSQRDKVKRDALITDAFLGAAVISAGISVYFTVTRSGGKHEDDSRGARLEVGPGSIAVAGRF